MRPIKVAEIVEATTGGTRRHVFDLVTHLAPEAFSTTVICSTLRDEDFLGDIPKMREKGVEVEVVPMSREVAPLADPVALFRIWRILRRGRFDVVHTHSSKAGLLGRVAARLAGIRGVVHTAHAFPFLMDVPEGRRRAYAFFERFAARLSHRLVCVCESEREEALRYGVAEPGRLTVIENGVDAGEIERTVAPERAARLRRGLSIPGDHLVVGTAGRFVPQKGHAILVQAAERVLKQEPRTVFVLVGGGELQEGLAQMMDSLSIRERFRIVPQTEDVFTCMSLFDLFVLPSLWEALPYSLLEAMALGKATVATEVGGVAEAVTHGVTGLLVRPNDPAALADAIVIVLQDAAGRERMGRNGRECVRERYRRDTMIAKIENLYRDAAGRGADAETLKVWMEKR